MSFQFNFAIDETEGSFTECELSSQTHLGSSECVSTVENPEKNKLPLGDSEAHPETTDEIKATGLMTSAGENNTFSCSNTSSGGFTGEKAAGSAVATEHKIPEDVSRVLENKIVESVSGLQFVSVSVVEMTLSGEESSGENIISKTVTYNSDLISGVYEGGMKIWECTFDLIRYLEDEDVDFKGKRVLDLGCGAGLLGILALKRKAKEVHFQDYNSTVIKEITVPNALVNCDRDDSNEYIMEEPGRKRQKKSEIKPGLISKCRFFSGEWSQFSKLMQNKMSSVKYDAILTSETIYNPAYYGALHDIFQHLLAKNGIVYLASKSHYFGVGGGVHLFETYITEKNVFCVKTLKVYEEGLQRMLICLSFKSTS